MVHGWQRMSKARFAFGRAHIFGADNCIKKRSDIHFFKLDSFDMTQKLPSPRMQADQMRLLSLQCNIDVKSL